MCVSLRLGYGESRYYLSGFLCKLRVLLEWKRFYEIVLDFGEIFDRPIAGAEMLKI